MNASRRRFLATAAASSFHLALSQRLSAFPQLRGKAGDLGAQLDRTLPQLFHAHNVPGAQIALIENYRVVWGAGYGVSDNEKKTPVLQSTRFEGASLSKPLFTTLVLRLADDKQFDIDIPLARYDSARYVADDARMEQLTARHVLTHSSGWPNWRRGKPLAFVAGPGERYGYSGEGFFYLQRVVEKRTGKSLETLMRAHVLDPLGLTETSYEWHEELAGNVASGHDAAGKPMVRLALRGPQPTAAEPESTSPNAASSVYTTASDFARFMGAVMDPAPSSILSTNSKRLMLTTAVKVDDDLSRSVGWGVQRHNGVEALFHNGNNYFVLNFAIGFPASGSGIVCLTNGVKGKAVYSAAINMVTRAEMPAVLKS